MMVISNNNRFFRAIQDPFMRKVMSETPHLALVHIEVNHFHLIFVYLHRFFPFGVGSSPPGAAVAVELDVAWREKEVDAVIQLAWDAFGGLDIVVNNAGLRGTRLPSTNHQFFTCSTPMILH